MGDIDKSLENRDGADNFKSFYISLHYDLFTPGPNSDDEYFDDSYYANFRVKGLISYTLINLEQFLMQF